jgi:hypothetical protein
MTIMYCGQLECIVCNCIMDNWNILCVSSNALFSEKFNQFFI